MVKRRIIWSPRAKRDLFSILDYYFKRNGSKTYSIKLNASLRASIRLLENHPRLGFKSDVKNVRILIHGDYGVFYEIREGTIELITIRDSRQDPKKIGIKNK
ncbi:MAG: type II toxin-antitoxin system RelE/ParE family toxin [Bacteroidales bacterium]|nr:type II toxin-antitoxin system RelE/ParE family toxin [Bacteroidales bacterium]